MNRRAAGGGGKPKPTTLKTTSSQHSPTQCLTAMPPLPLQARFSLSLKPTYTSVHLSLALGLTYSSLSLMYWQSLLRILCRCGGRSSSRDWQPSGPAASGGGETSACFVCIRMCSCSLSADERNSCFRFIKNYGKIEVDIGPVPYAKTYDFQSKRSDSLTHTHTQTHTHTHTHTQTHTHTHTHTTYS
jgi:hypothetical protein